MLLGQKTILTAVLIAAFWAWPAGPIRSQEAGEMERAVIEAFRAVHVGYSVDEVLVDDHLNAAFIRQCRHELPETDETTLNRTLVNLRKAGKLNVPTTRRRVLRHEAYLHAAEIAARLMYDRYHLTVDRVMCDPQRRREFDRVAGAIAPDVPAYRLRKAALGLRKARKLQPELVARVAEWGKKVLTLPAGKIVESPESVPEAPGVYIFRDSSGYLYIGESSNLQDRVTKHLDESDRRSLANYFAAHGIENVTVELHVFDPKSGARRKSMRRAYESDLIRSRKPRLNIAP